MLYPHTMTEVMCVHVRIYTLQKLVSICVCALIYIESSLYSSPNVNSGSFKLSPVRKRRLVYKRLPSSSDGQTKLAFE